jgi:hypothetical protein
LIKKEYCRVHNICQNLFQSKLSSQHNVNEPISVKYNSRKLTDSVCGGGCNDMTNNCLSIQLHEKPNFRLYCESVIEILNFQGVELNSRILSQPPSPSDPRTLTPHPIKYTTDTVGVDFTITGYRFSITEIGFYRLPLLVIFTTPNTQ